MQGIRWRTIMGWLRRPIAYVALALSTVWLVTACAAQNGGIRPLPPPTVEQTGWQDHLPRVLITTDINIGQGDPDDRQSMAHLLMYADEVNIRGIIPYRLNAGGVEATLMALDAYEQDYNDPSTQYQARRYPPPDTLRATVARNQSQAQQLFLREAHQATPRDPLYVLAWGDMGPLRDALMADPAIAPNLRVLSIGTNLRNPHGDDCRARNWNSGGRDDIYHDARFNQLWWVENDWTFEGMFWGEEPRTVLEQLKGYGALGYHLWEVVQSQDWARYFRAGDTPSLLYLLDPNHPLDDPTQGSWAGQFHQPFPDTRPNYYTDINGGVDWDYDDACRTWTQVETVYQARVQTLLERRPAMYRALLEKLDRLYGQTTE